MKIDGTVTTGLGKAAYFLSQDFYVNNFKKNCGFRPYPGTLNVIVPEEYLPQINKVKNECKNIIKPDDSFHKNIHRKRYDHSVLFCGYCE